MKKYDLEKPYVYIIYLAIALTLCGLIATFTQINRIPVFRLCIIIVGYLLVLYYTFIGYRTPHGNLLRYLILGFGILLILTGLSSALVTQPDPAEAVNELKVSSTNMMADLLILGLCILLSGYIAGRLNKFEQNKYLFTLVLILLIVRVFFSSNNQTIILSDFNEVILWFDISCAYFARINQH